MVFTTDYGVIDTLVGSSVFNLPVQTVYDLIVANNQTAVVVTWDVSATDGYDAGYFIVQLTDTTNGSYNMAEMLVMDDYLLAEESGNTLDLEYGNIGVSGIGTLFATMIAPTGTSLFS